MRFPIPSLLAALCIPAVAAAQPAPAPTPLDAKINEQTSQGSGLTSDEVVKRAKATSFELRGEQEKIRAAQAAVDQALAGYIPRLTVTGRYTRLSSITQGELGTLVAAPSVGPGPIPAGTQLVNIPLEFPVLLNNTSFQGQLVIPLSDYFLRVPHGVNSARSSERAAVQNEVTASQQTILDSRQRYYDWVRARLQQIVAQQSLEQQKANLSDVQKQAQVGTASRADVLRVQSQARRPSWCWCGR
jgi:outer membrane protein